MQNDINIKNRRASFDYEFLEEYTAGIMLTGTEIKSIRAGKAGLVDSYCYFHNGELWIKGMYVAEYKLGTYYNHIERRERKLLLQKNFSNSNAKPRNRDSPSSPSASSSTRKALPNSASPSPGEKKNTTNGKPSNRKTPNGKWTAT